MDATTYDLIIHTFNNQVSIVHGLTKAECERLSTHITPKIPPGYMRMDDGKWWTCPINTDGSLASRLCNQVFFTVQPEVNFCECFDNSEPKP